MSLGVIFVATSEEADLLNADSSLLEYYPSVEAKDIGIGHVTALHRILNDAETDALPPGPDPNGSTTFPDDLAKLIAAIHDDDLDAIAVRWSQYLDFSESRWPIADVRELLARIVELAGSARSQQSLLHIRQSLLDMMLGCNLKGMQV